MNYDYLKGLADDDHIQYMLQLPMEVIFIISGKDA